MKNSHLLKKSMFSWTVTLLFFIGILSFLPACKGTKELAKVERLERIELPFTESKYRSDDQHFRFTQSETAGEISEAKSIAFLRAQTGIAQTAQTFLSGVASDYLISRKVDKESETGRKFQSLFDGFVNMKLSNTRIIGEEVYKHKDQDKYTYYICLEMDMDELIEESTSGIKRDAGLKLDFDESQFRKFVEERRKELNDKNQESSN